MTVILWPQWIGATERGRAIEVGSRHLAAAFDPNGENIDVEIPVNETIDRNVERGIVGRRAILDGLLASARAFNSATGPVLLLGGDCSTDVALIAHANSQVFGELKVIYFDAHADLNTPDVSPSGAFHGMVLGHLLGAGDSDVGRHIPVPLRADQIHYRGVRVLDESESAVMQTLGISVEPLDAEPPEAPLHVHIDLDVLDPNSFPHTTWPTAGGPTIDQLVDSVATLIDTNRVSSVAVTECAAASREHVEVLEPLLDVLRRWVL